MEISSTKCVCFVVVLLLKLESMMGERSSRGYYVVNPQLETSSSSISDLDLIEIQPFMGDYNYPLDQNEPLGVRDTNLWGKLSEPQLQESDTIIDEYGYDDALYNELASYFSGVDEERGPLKDVEAAYSQVGLPTYLAEDPTPSGSSYNSKHTQLDRFLKTWKQTKGDYSFSYQNNFGKEIQVNMEEMLVVSVVKETIFLLPKRPKKRLENDGNGLLPGIGLKLYAPVEDEEEPHFHLRFGFMMGPILMGMGLFCLFLMCRTMQKNGRGKRSRNKNKEETELILTTV